MLWQGTEDYYKRQEENNPSHRGIAVIVWGVKAQGWGFGDIATTFLIMGVISSFIMGWGPNTIAEKMASGFKDIAVACLMIGIARGILVILQSAGHGRRN